MMKSTAILAAAVGVAAITFPGPPADARIACRDGFQNVAGNMIATPYCQDDLLAKVAHEYGMKVSAAKIRDNPNFKREVCRHVGHDIRVSQHCINEGPSIRHRAF